MTLMTTFHSGDAIAARPVSGASLAAFRVVFGAVGVLSMVRIAAYGWIDSLYAGPSHHFHYPGLHWVTDPGRGGTVLLVTGVALSALAVAVGWHTRAAVALFLFGFGWIEAIDVTTYLNHYWFMTIVGIVMLVAPIAATGSLDARRRGGARPVAVAWVWLFRALVGAVYTFAGVAKLRTDWLLDGRPLRLWLPAHADLPVVGGLLADPTTALVASWAGAAFDCLIVALLLWRRTRFAAWLTAVAFHTVTGLLFPIGVFPFLMAGGALVFFAPDWPATVWARVRSWGRATRLPGPGRTDEPTAPAPLGAWTRVAMVGAVALNLVVPLRQSPRGARQIERIAATGEYHAVALAFSARTRNSLSPGRRAMSRPVTLRGGVATVAQVPPLTLRSTR